MNRQSFSKEIGSSQVVGFSNIRKVAILSIWFTVMLTTLMGCKPAGINSEYKLDRVIEKQKAEENPFAVYQYNSDQAAFIYIDKEDYEKKADSDITQIAVYSAIDKDSFIVVRTVSFANGNTIALFNQEDEKSDSQLIPYESTAGFLTDKENRLIYSHFIEIEKDGQTIPVSFFEISSNINADSVDPDLIQKAQTGDENAFEELIRLFREDKNVTHIKLTNVVTGKEVTTQKGDKNWDNAFTNLVTVLTGAKPAQAADQDQTSPTPEPSLTPPPTSTPEPSSTPTEIPIPTLAPELVGGLEGIPDPKISNPELFDLTNPKAPIPEFVYAMRMAGIELTGEQVSAEITYQELKDKNGNPFIVAVYNLDPDPSKTGETLEGKITLMISKKNKNSYEWKSYSHGELASTYGIFVGVSDSITESLSSSTLGEFNQIVLGDALWRIPYSSSKSLFPSEGRINPQPLINAVNTAQRRYPSSKLMVFHLNWGNHVALPDWLLNGKHSKEQLKQMDNDYIVKVMTPLKGKVDSWVVVNEPFGNYWSWESNKDTRFWHDKLGPDTDWIKEAFRTAHQVDPETTLILNDYGIEIGGNILYDSVKANKIFSLVKELHQEGIPVAVGFQMHLNLQYQNPTNSLSENFRRVIKQYKNAGIKVKITEWDIRIDKLSISFKDKQLLQAEAYGELMKVALEEGIIDINFFGTNDETSWLKTYNAEATLKNRQNSPKPAWFIINQVLTQYILDST